MKKREYPCCRRMKLAEVALREDNPRRITAEKRAKLKKSIEGLGDLQPVTFNVRTKTLLGGHQRVSLLLENGELEADVWCVDLPKEKEKAAMLALNTSAGEWDDDKLGAFLKDLNSDFFDLAEALKFEPRKFVLEIH